MVKIQWRRKDIEHMKQLYINHQPIKIIARLLNRTPTSVNKALSRFGIRQKRLPHDKVTACNKVKSIAAQHLTYSDSPHQQSFREKWVSLDFVYTWLRGRNIHVERMVCSLTQKIHFIIGNTRLHPSALVLLFNRKRLEEGLEVCWVEKVSC